MAEPSRTTLMRIRPESAADNASVHHVVERAFGGAFETDLVRRLRDTPVAFASLVAEAEGQVVGHALLTLVTVEATDALLLALALGPVAVLPPRQRHGVGSALINACVAQARASAHPGLFVLGASSYYARFGFEPTQPWGLRVADANDAHSESLLVLPFAPELLRAHAGRVRYDTAFGNPAAGDAAAVITSVQEATNAR